MDYEKLHDLVDCEIDKITSKPELNDAALANLYKLVDVKKDLFEIEDEEMGMSAGNDYQSSHRGYGYSRRGSYSMRQPMYGNYSMEGDNSSYTHLEEAMKYATSEQEREAIRKLINQNYR